MAQPIAREVRLRLQDSMRGCLVGTALADACCSPLDGASAAACADFAAALAPSSLPASLPQLRALWSRLSRSSYTSHTRAAICVAKCLRSCTGAFDAAELARVLSAAHLDDAGAEVAASAPPAIEAEMSAHQRASGHRNVCTLHGTTKRAGSGSSDPHEVLALLEHCPVSLAAHLSKRPRDEEHVLKLFAQVCEAVAHIHSLSPPMAHRDIKVENVLMSEEGLCKLCDFGSATSTFVPRGCATKEELVAAEIEIQQLTTPEYRAPEAVDVWRRLPIGLGQDVWALGCLLYAMLYGVTPFPDGSLQILSANVSFPSKPAVSEKVKGLIKSVFVVDPDERPDVFQLLDGVCSILGTRNPYASRIGVPRTRPSSVHSPAPAAVSVSASPLSGAQCVALHGDPSRDGRSPSPQLTRLASPLTTSMARSSPALAPTSVRYSSPPVQQHTPGSCPATPPKQHAAASSDPNLLSAFVPPPPSAGHRSRVRNLMRSQTANAIDPSSGSVSPVVAAPEPWEAFSPAAAAVHPACHTPQIAFALSPPSDDRGSGSVSFSPSWSQEDPFASQAGSAVQWPHPHDQAPPLPPSISITPATTVPQHAMKLSGTLPPPPASPHSRKHKPSSKTIPGPPSAEPTGRHHRRSLSAGSARAWAEAEKMQAEQQQQARKASNTVYTQEPGKTAQALESVQWFPN
eukprot:m51a1_g1204 putative nak protein kinase (686) ;mRNA; r:459413-461980